MNRDPIVGKLSKSKRFEENARAMARHKRKGQGDREDGEKASEKRKKTNTGNNYVA